MHDAPHVVVHAVHLGHLDAVRPAAVQVASVGGAKQQAGHIPRALEHARGSRDPGDTLVYKGVIHLGQGRAGARASGMWCGEV